MIDLRIECMVHIKGLQSFVCIDICNAYDMRVYWSIHEVTFLLLQEKKSNCLANVEQYLVIYCGVTAIIHYEVNDSFMNVMPSFGPVLHAFWLVYYVWIPQIVLTTHLQWISHTRLALCCDDCLMVCQHPDGTNYLVYSPETVMG